MKLSYVSLNSARRLTLATVTLVIVEVGSKKLQWLHYHLVCSGIYMCHLYKLYA